jgi:hypothetical protein
MTRVGEKASRYLLGFKDIVCWNNNINGNEICIEILKLDSETNDVMESNIYANREDENKSVTLASNEDKVVKN